MLAIQLQSRSPLDKGIIRSIQPGIDRSEQISRIELGRLQLACPIQKRRGARKSFQIVVEQSEIEHSRKEFRIEPDRFVPEPLGFIELARLGELPGALRKG